MFRRAVVKAFSISHDSFSTEQISHGGPYRKKLATRARLANQIQGFRIPAC